VGVGELWKGCERLLIAAAMWLWDCKLDSLDSRIGRTFWTPLASAATASTRPGRSCACVYRLEAASGLSLMRNRQWRRHSRARLQLLRWCVVERGHGDRCARDTHDSSHQKTGGAALTHRGCDSSSCRSGSTGRCRRVGVFLERPSIKQQSCSGAKCGARFGDDANSGELRM
jgi:hypothetical protein